jgi:CubicO group peptidase (beta-lactamase class C family)
MQLVEQGKISVSDPVSKYYAAAPKAWEKVTIKHLLTHRSGIPSYTSLPGFFEKESRTDRTPDEIIGLTRDMPLEFEPGAKFAYDNTGYVILGYIIEKLSGQSYADYVRDHVFAPAGMTHSGYEVSSALPAGYAQGFAILNDNWVKAPPLSMTLPYSAGSLYSTVDDLLRWEQALFADKVVSKASREEMMTDHGNGYGYGLTMWKLEGHSAVSHSGGINGFSSYLIRFPDDGVTVAVLSNLGGAPVDTMSEEIARAYFGLPPIPPPPVLVEVPVKTEVLERYDGVYELLPGFDITVSHKDGKLVAQATGQGEFTLLATSDTEFHFQPAGLKMVFPEGTGKAPSFVLHQGGERVAKRKP